MGQIQVYNLGEGGVDVDSNTTRTADNSASELQNASYDSTRKRQGGLTKRPGFAKFNASVLGGVVLGGVEAPYTGVAGASGSGGGGLPGNLGGTGGVPPGGGGTGGGGGVGPGGNLTTGGTGGTSVTTGGRQLFNGRRIILVGRDLRTGGVPNDNGMGWYLTSETFQDTAWLTGTDSPDTLVGAGPPGACKESVPNDSTRAAPGACAVVNGWLYYPQHMVVTSGQPSTDVRGVLRRTDGYTDETVLTIPRNPFNPDTRQGNRIVSMLVADGGIYISVCDKGQTSGGESATTHPDWGRVFFFNPSSSALQELNLTSPTTPAGFAYTPYSLASYAGRLYFGGLQTDGTSNSATIDYVQPDLPPLLDLLLASPFFRTTCMAVYQGQLYAGFQMRATGGVGVIDFAQVYTRLAAAVTPGSTPWATSLTATGGTAQANNLFSSMVVFGNKLYVAYFNNTQTAKIYSFDGTTWTAVYTAATSSTRAPLYLFVDTNAAGVSTLYAYGLAESTAVTWLTSTDGTTWVVQSAQFSTNVHGTTFGTSEPLPVFFGFEQR